MSALTTPSRPRSFWPVLFWYGGLTMLLLGELAVMLRPEQLPWLALFGLAYPLSSAVFLVGTLGAWAVRRWRLGLIGLLVISVLSSHYTSTWGGWGRGQAQEAEVQTLRVLTWNVRQFNRYAWIEKPHVRDSILAYLSRQEADVICLQECFLEDRRQPWMSSERLKQATGMTHWEEEFKLGRGQDKLFGLAVLSRYPIAAKEAIRFENDKNNSAMSVDLLVEGDTVRVYNVHLSSIGFEKEDYEAARNVGDEQNRSRLFARLSNAWSKRAQQALQVQSSVEGSPFPVVLAGDFNDTPVSYAAERLSGTLNDAYGSCRPQGGSFLGATYTGQLPFLRIDQMWASPELEVLSYETGAVELSDHRPVQAVFAWDKAALR